MSTETMSWQQQLRPGAALRAIVTEATEALIAMNPDRLEELARCCADLNRELIATGKLAEAASELRSDSSPVRILGRVLFESQANLKVLTRLYVLRLHDCGNVSMEPGDSPGRGDAGRNNLEWGRAKRTVAYGDH